MLEQEQDRPVVAKKYDVMLGKHSTEVWADDVHIADGVLMFIKRGPTPALDAVLLAYAPGEWRSIRLGGIK